MAHRTLRRAVTWIPSFCELVPTAEARRDSFLWIGRPADYKDPLAFVKLAEAVPEANIILGHMGGYFHVEEAIEVAARLPNVYLETSAMPYPGMIRRAIDAVGAHRMLFASDGPGCLPSLEVQKVRLAGMTSAEEERIFSANILELLERVVA